MAWSVVAAAPIVVSTQLSGSKAGNALSFGIYRGLFACVLLKGFGKIGKVMKTAKTGRFRHGLSCQKKFLRSSAHSPGAVYLKQIHIKMPPEAAASGGCFIGCCGSSPYRGR